MLQEMLWMPSLARVTPAISYWAEALDLARSRIDSRISNSHEDGIVRNRSFEIILNLD